MPLSREKRRRKVSRRICLVARVSALANLLLNAEQLVVLRDALAVRWRTRLDPADAERDDVIRNERVLRLAPAVQDHHAVALGLRELDRHQNRADLVDLQCTCFERKPEQQGR